MGKRLKTLITWGILFAFLGNFCILPPAYAQELFLPKPGQMVALSPAFNPVVLKGIKLDPDNPLRFHFLLDQGDSKSPEAKGESTLAKGDYLKQEAT